MNYHGKYHYYTGLEEHTFNNGEIHSDRNYAAQKCHFLCVKGDANSSVSTLNQLYKIHRSKKINVLSVSSNIRSFVRYLIYKLDSYRIFHESRVDYDWGTVYPVVDDGVAALKKSGYFNP